MSFKTHKFINKVLIIISILLFGILFSGCNLLEEDEPDIVVIDKKIEPKTEIDDNKASEETLKFSTLDINGNPVTEEIIKDAKLVLINFWEPWCGPCVGEMPELEELYENYSSQGLLILGVYSTEGMDDEVMQVLEECNTSYPIIRSDSNLQKYMTDYVPTTIFVDSDGNILSSEPIIGANSYSDWEEIVNMYLDEE